MVACAANKNNSKSKKMETIDEDAALAPNNPIEEEIGMMLPHHMGKLRRQFQKNEFPRRK